MTRFNEIEEIIRLIYKGFDLELISFELDIPIEQLHEYEKRLEIRQLAKQSIKNENIGDAIDKLNTFIKNTDNNVVERAMLLKLMAYKNKINVKEDLHDLEQERKKLGFSNSIDEILEELKVQIPKRKNKNIIKEQNIKKEEQLEENKKEISKTTYERIINKYKTEIELNPQDSQIKRNLLAFAYFKTGKVNEARNELMSLIQENNNYMSYRQLVYIEKKEGNFKDAKLWAYEALDNFPNNIEIREQLIRIAKEENDEQEVISQLKKIISINPKNEKNKNRLQTITDRYER